MRTAIYSLAVMAASIAAVLAALPSFGRAQIDRTPHTGEPVLIELFTSQGCSSCPPADRLAQRLSKEPGLVVISRPVDYWDRLGWKDTLASPENTALQRAYAARGLAGYNGVYTPQSVVAGRFGEVGSDERKIRQFVKRSAAENDAVLRIRGSAERGYGAGISGTISGTAQLILVGVSSRENIDIRRGENRGRQISYTNVLVGERKLTTWRGSTQGEGIRLSQLDMEGADKYALILRRSSGGEVLAATWID